MPKRPQRLHLSFAADTPAPARSSEPVYQLNAHLKDRPHDPDQRQDRKRMRQHLHLLEGSGFDPDLAADVADAA